MAKSANNFHSQLLRDRTFAMQYNKKIELEVLQLEAIKRRVIPAIRKGAQQLPCVLFATHRD